MGTFEVVGPVLLVLVVAPGLGWFGYRFWWTGNGGPTVSKAAPQPAAAEGSHSGGKKWVMVVAALLVIAVAVLRPDRSRSGRL